SLFLPGRAHRARGDPHPERRRGRLHAVRPPAQRPRRGEGGRHRGAARLRRGRGGGDPAMRSFCPLRSAPCASRRGPTTSRFALRSGHSGARGFTLLEMMLAIAVLAVSLLWLVEATTRAIEAENHAKLVT